MSAIEQWVNLPKESRFAEDGITMQQLGDVTLEATLQQDGSPVQFNVRIVPAGGNATYTPTEMAHGCYKGRRTQATLSDTQHVLFEEALGLPAAGGGKFTIEAKDHHGNKVKADQEVETRRKLYYQVIEQKGTNAYTKALTPDMRTEYWNPGRKHFLRLREIESKGGAMKGLPNYDETERGGIPALAKPHYNPAKDPYCFAIIIVNHLAKSEKTVHKSPKFEVGKGPAQVDVPIQGTYLWTELDDAGSAGSRWYWGGAFVEDGTNRRTGISKAWITYPPAGATKVQKVTIDTSHLTPGLKGILRLKLKVVKAWNTGVSLGSYNTICLANKTVWKARTMGEMKGTLVHEAGHKVGMVPGKAGSLLDKQTTFYYQNGGHCNTGNMGCVMYHMYDASRPEVFCGTCSESVQKMCMDSAHKPGFLIL